MTQKKKEQILDNNLRLYVENGDMAQVCNDIFHATNEEARIKICSESGAVLYNMGNKYLSDIVRFAESAYSDAQRCNKENIKKLMFDTE